MRNYVRVKALWYHGHQGAATAELFAFGGTTEQLMAKMNPQVADQLATFPAMVFDKHGPFNVFFELNLANVVKLLNGPPLNTFAGLPSAGFAGYNFNSTPLNAITISTLNTSSYLFDMAEVESPRKIWSHGH